MDGGRWEQPGFEGNARAVIPSPPTPWRQSATIAPEAAPPPPTAPPSGHVALDTADETLNRLYPLVGESVDGRTVRSHVPNEDSIGASFDNFEVLPGIREVPSSFFRARAAGERPASSTATTNTSISPERLTSCRGMMNSTHRC
jgi:hypothetical protein